MQVRYSIMIMVLAALVMAVPAHAGPGKRRAKKAKAAEKLDTEESAGQPAEKLESQPAGQPAKQTGPCMPWVCGVPEDRQEQAMELYQAGNKLFEELLFAPAADRYRSALQHWKHPGIHYNLALVEMALDRPIEAYENVREALRHGADALQPDEYRQARTLGAQLRQRIAEVRVVCNEPDAVVTLDGKPLFTGPGEATRLVLVGEHQIDARKLRYVSASKAVILSSGETATVEIRLIPEDQAQRSVRHWPAWISWTVVVAGVGVGTFGLVSHGWAKDNYEEYERDFNIRCPVPRGCSEYPPDLAELYDRARWQQGLAYGSYIAGSLAVVGGAWMIYHNRERTLENEALRDMVRVSVIPLVTDQVRGVAAAVSF
jgi:tetratricopeptide (TPR) repeat protein